MSKKLALASIYTLTLLAGFLAAVILVAMYFTGTIDITTMFVVTIGLNVVLWLLGPYVMDLVHKIFYKAKFLSAKEFSENFTELHNFLQTLCQNNKIKIPKIRFIEDDNPTAYTYGSGAFNARVVITRGLFVYLTPEEVQAVLAHEIGHIVHKDFIVMSVANTLLQLLYEISQIFLRKKSNSGGGKKNAFAIVGFVAYIFYLVGYYVVLYLNRLRESYADEFSAQVTGQPHLLSSALIKIGYGIVAKQDTGRSIKLMESSSTLGIMGIKSAKEVGLIAQSTNMDPGKVAKILVFDHVSPWAKIAELGSTHPLIGKRLANLDAMAVQGGQKPMFNIPQILQENPVDKKRLWNNFTLGVTVYLLPYVVAALGGIFFLLVLGLKIPINAIEVLAVFVSFFGLSLLFRVLYKFPSDKNAQPADIYSLMSDPYASPVKGEPVSLAGNVIGRGVAGFKFSEDIMLQDQTGLMYLDYEAGIPFFGNILFAWKKVKQLLGQPVSARGWFFRGSFHYVVLSKLDANGQTILGYAKFWNIFGAIIITLIGIGGLVQSGFGFLVFYWPFALLAFGLFYFIMWRKNAIRPEKKQEPVKTLPNVPKPS